MIIISKEDSNKQVASLLERYPNLTVTSKTENKVDIKGKIHINRNCDKISVCKEYGIEISIPLNSDKLPMVRDTEKYIRNYPHLNWNKDLCLATDTDIYLRFRNGLDLIGWMRDYVEIYFVSYEYYKRYNRFPFGERAHGSQGILQFYRDYFNLSTGRPSQISSCQKVKMNVTYCLTAIFTAVIYNTVSVFKIFLFGNFCYRLKYLAD